MTTPIEKMAVTLSNIAKAYHELSDTDNAFIYYKEALKIYKVLPDREHSETKILEEMLYILRFTSNNRQAVELTERILELNGNKLSNESYYSIALDNLCFYYSKLERNNSEACSLAKGILFNTNNSYLSSKNCAPDDCLIMSFHTLTKQWLVCEHSLSYTQEEY